MSARLPLTFDDARADCQAQGGDLAMFMSGGELDGRALSDWLESVGCRVNSRPPPITAAHIQPVLS
jgi:hypothetical protein